MKIYYSFPLQKIEENANKYQKVIESIKSRKHSLTREWLSDALNNIKLKREQPSRSKMYPEVMKAIREADVCIFDVTVKSMSVGQQIIYALERRKPTLMISDANKGDLVSSLMIFGSKSGYLFSYDYISEEEMLQLIDSFLNNKEIINPPQRFNLFLEKSLADYVNWRAFDQVEFKNKTDVISQAMKDAMEEDTEYQEFLDFTKTKNRI